MLFYCNWLHIYDFNYSKYSIPLLLHQLAHLIVPSTLYIWKSSIVSLQYLVRNGSCVFVVVSKELIQSDFLFENIITCHCKKSYRAQ